MMDVGVFFSPLPVSSGRKYDLDQQRGHKVFPCCLEARDGKRESRTVSDLVLCPNCRFITSQLCPWAYYAIISSSGHSCFVVFLTWPYFSLVAGRDRFIVLPLTISNSASSKAAKVPHSSIYITADKCFPTILLPASHNTFRPR